MKRSSAFGKQFLKDIRILLSNLNDIESWEDNIAKKKSSFMKSQLVRALDISGLDFEIEEEKRYGHLNRRHSCWFSNMIWSIWAVWLTRGPSMFGTSNFGPKCALRHLMLTSAPWKMITYAEIHLLGSQDLCYRALLFEICCISYEINIWKIKVVL